MTANLPRDNAETLVLTAALDTVSERENDKDDNDFISYTFTLDVNPEEDPPLSGGFPTENGVRPCPQGEKNDASLRVWELRNSQLASILAQTPFCVHRQKAVMGVQTFSPHV